MLHSDEILGNGEYRKEELKKGGCLVHLLLFTFDRSEGLMISGRNMFD